MSVGAVENIIAFATSIGRASNESATDLDKTSFDVEVGLVEIQADESAAELSTFASIGSVIDKIRPNLTKIETESKIMPTLENIENSTVSTGSIDSEKPRHVQPMTLESSVKNGAITLRTLETPVLTTGQKAHWSPPILQESPINPVVVNALTPIRIEKPLNSEIISEQVINSPKKADITWPIMLQTEPRNILLHHPHSATEMQKQQRVLSVPDFVQNSVVDLKTELKSAEIPLIDSDLPVTPRSSTPVSSEFSIQNRPSPNLPSIFSSIAAAIAERSGGIVEIRLDPPELGKVSVTITPSDVSLSAVVTADKAEIAELLRRNSELLSRELSRSGFEETTLEFSHREQTSDEEPIEFHISNETDSYVDEAAANAMDNLIYRIETDRLDIRL